MPETLQPPSPSLYLADETAWLERTAELIRSGRVLEVDLHNLAEYLTDMAIRDRREVRSRLKVLLAHLLKWHHQPDKRTASWEATILDQRDELKQHASTGVLRNHAEEVLAESYTLAVKLAAVETGLPVKTFPAACPFTVDELFIG